MTVCRREAKAVKLIRPNNVRDRLLSQREIQGLFAAADAMDDYTRPLFYLLFFTGMRLSEALSLQWPDIEPEHARILIRDSKTGEGRKIPLHPELAAELKRWRRFTGGRRWVVPSPTDNKVRIHTIRKGWVRLCKAAKVENLTRHDLRHNFVSRLQAEGVSDSIIMDITGHKTHAMLYRYSHSDDEMRRQAVTTVKRPEPLAAVIPLPRKA